MRQHSSLKKWKCNHLPDSFSVLPALHAQCPGAYRLLIYCNAPRPHAWPVTNELIQTMCDQTRYTVPHKLI